MTEAAPGFLSVGPGGRPAAVVPLHAREHRNRCSHLQHHSM